eukprot:CAMPEP_0169276382 /NCGR_PEP_ID=MMETSP1016-20121227/52975_1 /TAXON_ID=342587 /ORGANISM="Karlodinium micrum, Strain CCMP2283" /LENGTH=273 /DNA_ID=CAMNT_0009363499 /DNA_START=95 /DNA_END=916 /DNA_ORIENTATION=+
MDTLMQDATETTEVRGDDPMVMELMNRCREMNLANGWRDELGMDQLMNPATVINIEMDLRKLRGELNETTDRETREQLQEKIATKEQKQQLEMRGIMQDWLKQLFVISAALGTFGCGLLAYDNVPFTSDPLLRLFCNVFGFWSIWLWTIPTLRARKPGGFWGMDGKEKRALDIAFILDFFFNLLAPFATKDTSTLFVGNLALLGACYAVGYLTPDDQEGNLFKSLPKPVKWVLMALDPGSGKERGMKKEKREALEAKYREREEARLREEEGGA